MIEKRTHQKQRDANGLTAKDHVYRAFLDDPDITPDEAKSIAPEHSYSSICNWLNWAKREWLTGEPFFNRGTPDEPRIVTTVPKATRKLWAKMRERAFAKPPAKRQRDPFLRHEVERAAVEETNKHFTAEGYVVDSVERDNVGWDLQAGRGPIMLRLEVKGLSGPEMCVELTPNEYARMQEYRDSYRLCVVTNALADPKLAIFAFSSDIQSWADQEGRPLAIQEIVAARCRADQM